MIKNVLEFNLHFKDLYICVCSFSCWENIVSLKIVSTAKDAFIFLALLFGINDETIMNTTKIPPINKRKKIKGSHLEPLWNLMSENISPLNIKMLILILTALFENTISMISLIIAMLKHHIIFFSLSKASVLGIEELRKMVFLLILLFFFFLAFFILFNKKLICMLSLESFMVYLIFYFFTFRSSSFFSSFIFFIFSVLIVVDRVFGLSLLVSRGRSSSLNNTPFSFY